MILADKFPTNLRPSKRTRIVRNVAHTVYWPLINPICAEDNVWVLVYVREILI